MSESKTEGTTNYIRYNPERVDYAISEEELNSLETNSKNIWKDFFLISLSIGIPTTINAIADTQTPFVLSLKLFLNYIFGVLGIVFSIIFGLMWRGTYISYNKIVKKIKNRPKFEVHATTSTKEQTNILSMSGEVVEENTQETVGGLSIAESFKLSHDESRFEIIKAEYRTQKVGVDVTEELRKMIANNKLETIASNDIKGDPDYGMVKRLSIEYKFNGIINTKEFLEGDKVSIP